MFGKIIKAVSKVGSIGGAVMGNPLVSAAASGLGALYQQSSAKSAASRQMQYQQDMSNTSYQRAMEDMRLAGLNPILAYSQGGASTPTGASYNPPNVGESAVKGAQSAAALANMQAQNVNLNQQTANMQTDERLSRENIRRLALENDAWSKLSPEVRAVVMSGGGISSAAAALRPASKLAAPVGRYIKRVTSNHGSPYRRSIPRFISDTAKRIYRK